jgi:chromosome partitioning protein
MEFLSNKTMRYAIWNNKDGVGKTFLSFVLSTEYANKHPDSQVVVADMCPQANLSEIILGGSEHGASRLEQLSSKRRKRSAPISTLELVLRMPLQVGRPIF